MQIFLQIHGNKRLQLCNKNTPMRTKHHILLLLLGLLLAPIVSHGQIIKARAVNAAFRYKNEYTGKWNDWSKWTETNIIVLIDGDEQRITVYSDETQIYDMVKVLFNGTDSDGDRVWKWLCINADGLRCHVRLIKLNQLGGKWHLYIEFDDLMWVYSIRILN
jgi:hypothetical protein